MADERRRRQWFRAVIVSMAVALVAAEAVAAGWSLVADEPWNWGRFWVVFFGVPVSAAASNVGQTLGRRTRPQEQRKFTEDRETAQAMRSGLLPPDADPEKWRARVRGHVRQAFVVVGLSSILGATAAVLTAVAAHENNHDDPVLWALAAVALLLQAPLFWLLARVRRQRQRLLARLQI